MKPATETLIVILSITFLLPSENTRKNSFQPNPAKVDITLKRQNVHNCSKENYLIYLELSLIESYQSNQGLKNYFFSVKTYNNMCVFFLELSSEGPV